MNQQKKMSLSGLIGLIITTIIGAGIFNLSKEMALVSSPGGVIVGWLITGIGMGTLAFAMQGLNQLKPELESGIFSYARAGFGDYMGFNSAWGYWLSTLIKNAAYGTLMFAALSYFFPFFEDGQNMYSIVAATILLWLIHWNVLQGAGNMERLNTLILIMKLLPILIFLIAAITAFKYDIFNRDFWGNLQENANLGLVFPQVKNTMLVTVFSFVGLESAVAFSGKAEKRSDVGKATLFGFAAVTLIYVLVTVLSFGIMSRQELQNLPNPALAYILERIIGKPGAIIVNLGVIMSIFGAWVSSTMLAEEVVYQSSHQGLFPQFFNQRNEKLVSVPSLTLSNLIIQVFFISFLLIPDAYSNLTKFASASILISYTCIGMYYLKVILKRSESHKILQIIVGLLSSLYMLWLIYASGSQFMALTIISLFPGSIMYIITRIYHQQSVFKGFEWILFLLLSVGMVWAVQVIF